MSHDNSSANPKDPQVLHEVDGIQEYDNNLPNWWLYTLYGAVIFAIGYWFYFHVFAVGALPPEAYRVEMAGRAARAGKTVAVTGDQLVELSKDAAAAAEGKATFMANCLPCHGPTGGGIVGPNLTDDSWIHGGSAENIYTTVKEGFPLKGMPAWGVQFGDRRTQTVVAYVLTLRNTNVAGGKPPQGEKYTDK